MHELEKRFPNIPEKLMVVVKVPSLDPRLGKVIYQNLSVPIEKCLTFIDSLDLTKSPKKAEPVKKENLSINKPIGRKSAVKKTTTEI